MMTYDRSRFLEEVLLGLEPSTDLLGGSKHAPSPRDVAGFPQLHGGRRRAGDVSPSMLHQQSVVMIDQTAQCRGSRAMISRTSLLEAEEVPRLGQMPVIDARRHGPLDAGRNSLVRGDGICGARFLEHAPRGREPVAMGSWRSLHRVGS